MNCVINDTWAETTTLPTYPLSIHGYQCQVKGTLTTFGGLYQCQVKGTLTKRFTTQKHLQMFCAINMISMSE